MAAKRRFADDILAAIRDGETLRIRAGSQAAFGRIASSASGLSSSSAASSCARGA